MKAIIQVNPKTGLVITEGISVSGKKYGKFMVKETSLSVNDAGFLTPQTRAAFIPVSEDQLELAKTTLKAGMEVPFAGRIQRIETRVPQYEGHKPKVIPADAKAGTPEREYLLDGALVYFQDKWNSDVNCSDILLSSSRVAEAVSSSIEDTRL